MKAHAQLGIMLFSALAIAGFEPMRGSVPDDLLISEIERRLDSVLVDNPQELHLPWNTSLTEADYREVAGNLGIELAAIKAIVEVETGHTNKGLIAYGKPVINFDVGMFRKKLLKRGYDLAALEKTHPDALGTEKQILTQEIHHRRLTDAFTIDSIAAVESTYWGMFQIGGFNWKRCGVESHHEFVSLMCRSERDQLNLFVEFISRANLVRYIRQKNWASFARLYNGPGYKKRNYDTLLRRAYLKHSKKSTPKKAN